MTDNINSSEKLKGIGFAVIATILWSLNYIIARGVYKSIGPVSLAFFRWSTATIILCPFAIKAFINEWPLVKQHLKQIIVTAFFGITLFNTFIYIAGHFTTAINLAVIGTTAAPVFVLIIAGLFLKITVTRWQIFGTMLCVIGILVLLSGGSLKTLAQFKLSAGDLWVLGASLAFAIYTILIRKKPSTLSSLTFLFTLFTAGTLLLLPAFIVERQILPPIDFSPKMFWIILYLGVGPSIISFLCWNLSIAKLGSPSTSIIGNLITAFSIVEAIFILHEKFSVSAGVSLIIILCGVIVANAGLIFLQENRYK
jgi:drug/metabolite transporter (DMT)-like permease